jgi:hypothetical protein
LHNHVFYFLLELCGDQLSITLRSTSRSQYPRSPSLIYRALSVISINHQSWSIIITFHPSVSTVIIYLSVKNRHHLLSTIVIRRLGAGVKTSADWIIKFICFRMKGSGKSRVSTVYQTAFREEEYFEERVPSWLRKIKYPFEKLCSSRKIPIYEREHLAELHQGIALILIYN